MRENLITYHASRITHLFMTKNSLQVGTQNQKQQLKRDLREAQQRLLEAESELAERQAAVNAFRMQCRLKIGRQVDDYLDLRNQKMQLWTRLQLLQQAQEFGIPYDEDDPFWRGREQAELHDDLPEDELLPELKDIVRDRAAEKRLYRELARRFHPDLAGSSVERAYMTAMMSAVNIAYAKKDVNALRDLADELDPTTISELAQIETAEIRKLREQILKLQRRRRRAIQRLKNLNAENTTLLWKKAEELEENGRPWWEDVRADLEKLIGRRRREITELQVEVDQLETQVEVEQKESEA